MCLTSVHGLRLQAAAFEADLLVDADDVRVEEAFERRGVGAGVQQHRAVPEGRCIHSRSGDCIALSRIVRRYITPGQRCITSASASYKAQVALLPWLLTRVQKNKSRVHKKIVPTCLHPKPCETRCTRGTPVCPVVVCHLMSQE